jgi:hypothetical protein
MSHFDSARALIAAQIMNSIFVHIEGVEGQNLASLVRGYVRANFVRKSSSQHVPCSARSRRLRFERVEGL